MRAETSTGAAVTAFTAPPFVFTVDTTAPSVPTLIRPASGDISNDNLPFFEWTPSTGDVVDYLLQVTSGDINAGPFVINELVAEPGTGHQAVTPLADNTYRWRVIARDAGALNTNPSGSRTFTVDVTPPGPPILAVPGPDQPVPTNTPTFVWVATGVEPVDEYRPQVTSGGSFNPPLDIEVLLSGDTTQFEVPTGDALADAVYQWRVIAGDAALNTASSITQSFRVDTTPPDPPALLLPGSDDLINGNTPFFQWASSPGDVAVFFLKVTSGDINTGPFDIDKPIAAAETSDQTVTPLNDATYRWRVIASDLVGNTSDSGVRLFTVDTTPPSPLPVLGTPANGVSINDKTPFFAWSPSAGDVNDYVLQVTSGGSFNPPLDIEAVIGHPGTGHQTASPLNDALYQWRVIIARDQLLNGAPSAISTFTVDTTPPGVPSLVSPQDNAFLNDNTPFFDWTPVTGDVFDYLLHVTSGDINAGPFDIEVAVPHPGTGHQAIAPLNDGVYQWQVIARDQVGNPQPYGIRTLTVDTIPPSPAPSLVQPASGDVSNDTNPFFQWTPSAGGVFDYLLQVTSGDINAGPFDIDIVVIHPGTGHQAVAPLNEGNYQWRVIARDRAGNPAPSLAGFFEVDITSPGQPVLVLPVDLPARAAFLNDNTPFFDWNAPAGEAVASYRLLVASGDINTGPIFIDQVISGQLTSFQVQPGTALPDAIYQWQVVASDIAENPNASDTRSFVVDTLPPPAPPALIQPVGGDISNNVTPLFEWAPSSEDVFDYLLQVTSGGSFNPPLDIEVVVLHPGTWHLAALPPNDSGYQWRVIARDAAFNTAS